MSDDPSTQARTDQEIRRLLASAPAIKNSCELDLLLFLYRHPRALLTSEQLAAFVGYEMKRVASAIDQFISARLLERTQHHLHAARMYELVLGGPNGEGHRALLELASTRQGRAQILKILHPGRSNPPLGIVRSKRRLHATG